MNGIDGEPDNSPHPSKPNVKFLDNSSNPLIKKFLKNTETPFIVLYSFTPIQKNDLELYAGEIITVVDSKDEGWWLGKNLAGKTGYSALKVLKRHLTFFETYFLNFFVQFFFHALLFSG